MENPKLVVTLNGQAMVEYDRNKRLPGHQRQFLDRMDGDMDQGFELAGQWYEEPDQTARAKFVAMHLVQALVRDDDSTVAATCAYLATRLPQLKQVKAIEQGEEFYLDLIFDRELKNQVSVQFDPGMPGSTH
jgi:hypothetical protein